MALIHMGSFESSVIIKTLLGSLREELPTFANYGCELCFISGVLLDNCCVQFTYFPAGGKCFYRIE